MVWNGNLRNTATMNKIDMVDIAYHPRKLELLGYCIAFYLYNKEN